MTSEKHAGAFAFCVCFLSLAGCRSGDPVTTTAVPGPQGRASGLSQYHEPRRGIDFQYPSAWKSEPEEGVPVNLTGKNDCAFTLIGEEALDRTPAAKNLQDLEKQAQGEHPGATFGPRPPWAGAQKPDYAYQMATTGHGKRMLEWDTTFQHDVVTETLIETMRDGDAECANQLHGVEQSFRLYAAVPDPPVGSGK